jgi:hypothetical protein
MNLKGNGNIYICAYYRRNVTDEESIRNFETSVTRASAKKYSSSSTMVFTVPVFPMENIALRTYFRVFDVFI